MALRTNKELLDHAKANGYAVGAFNVNNLEQVIAVLETAEEEKAPVIIAITEGAIKYAGETFFFKAAPVMAADAKIPASVHLDHGGKFANIVKCVKGGFSSVMFDGSSLPFEENAGMTKKVVEVAHPVGISVEGEIGHVGGKEGGVDGGNDEILTDPAEAKRFAEETGVDSLAVAVGTVHGMRTQTAKLDLGRISAISSVVAVPLVLHGASGVPDEVFDEVIARGIHKINIGTELQKSFSTAMRQFAGDNPKIIDIRKLFRPAIDGMKESVRTKIRLFKSNGKAW
ncbi:MAG TPA: class II fructose-bisphosphate aldolase [bacterium]|nr:class II fructose-bisphosphate aldolase [bacterium]